MFNVSTWTAWLRTSWVIEYWSSPVVVYFSQENPIQCDGDYSTKSHLSGVTLTFHLYKKHKFLYVGPFPWHTMRCDAQPQVPTSMFSSKHLIVGAAYLFTYLFISLPSSVYHPSGKLKLASGFPGRLSRYITSTLWGHRESLDKHPIYNTNHDITYFTY